VRLASHLLRDMQDAAAASAAPPQVLHRPPGPWVCLHDGVETEFDDGTNDASQELARAVIHRTLTSADQVTQLIQQGANPSIEPSLRAPAAEEDNVIMLGPLPSAAFRFPLLSLRH